MRTDLLCLASMLAVLAPSAARADDAALLDRIEQLEIRIQDLEASQPQAAQTASSTSWADRVRLSGSADTGYFGSTGDFELFDDSFQIWDLRFFVDAELGRDVKLGERTLFRDIAFTFEWNLVRIGELDNDVGEIYVDFQQFLGSRWFNFQLGRFQIPVGEAYLLYSRGYASRPFVWNPVGGPWWWDEGVRMYGSAEDRRYGYVASVSNGDTPFNFASGSGHQVTLKLFWQPLEWLYVSASGLRSGEVGGDGVAASNALWLGETWARPFGSSTSVPSFQDGEAVPPGPLRLHDTWLAAGDLILDFPDKLRLWVAYGFQEIDSDGGSLYDRELQYWIAELILRGAWFSEQLRPYYLGLRANGLGTYDRDEGYVLDKRLRGSVGYNAESLTAYSAVVGWDLTRQVRLRLEYTYVDLELVRGVPAAVADEAGALHAFIAEVGVAF